VTNGYLEFKKWTVREIAPPSSISNVDTFGVIKLNPTKSGGAEWFSTAWNNGQSRNLTEGSGNTDPYDNAFSYANGNPDTTPLQITGAGEAKITEYNDSCRMFVSGTWLNTEMTIYQFIETSDNSFHDIQPRSRSRHETACSFGNYLVKFRDTTGDSGNPTPQVPTEKLTSVEVEVLHPVYRRRLDEKIWATGIPKGQWVGFKQITRTMTSTLDVRVEGWVNYDIEDQQAWAKVSEFTITSSNLSPDSGWATDPIVTGCSNQGDGQANKIISGDPNMFKYTLTGNKCWWRINGMKNARWKFASVREIDPLP
jgi:hypothetical protein